MTVQDPINCPQCGYDLRGQIESRCPEYNFHYDLPALKALRRRAADDCLYPYLDAIPYLMGSVAIAFAGLVHSRTSWWPFLLLYAVLVPLLRGYILQDIREEFRNELDDLAFVPRWVLLVGLFPRFKLGDLVMVFAVTLSLLSRSCAILLTLGAVAIGAISTGIALVRQRRFEETNQHLALSPKQSLTLKRAQIVGVCSAVLAVMLLGCLG